MRLFAAIVLSASAAFGQIEVNAAVTAGPRLGFAL